MEETLAKMGRAVTAKDWQFHSIPITSGFHELFIDNAHNELLKTTLTNLPHAKSLAPVVLPVLPTGPGKIPIASTRK